MTLQAPAIRFTTDWDSWLLFPGDAKRDAVYLVGSQELDKYLTVPASRHALVRRIFEQLQAGIEPPVIEKQLCAEGMEVNVYEFCQMLAQKQLLAWEDAAQSEVPSVPQGLSGQLRALSWQVFTIDLRRLKSHLDYWATPLLWLLIVMTVASTLGVLAQGWTNPIAMRAAAQQTLNNQNLGWITLLNLLLIPFFVLAHESAHAIVATLGKIYPRQLTMRMYMLVTPYFSLQLPGLHTLPLNKRFLTIAAGPLMDLLLGNVCLLLAYVIGGAWLPWLLLLAWNNYGRFIFNILPVMPMSDGYVLLSQAAFREIDIRSHATQEFRRWRHKQPHQFKGKYVLFYLLNVGVATMLIAGAFWQLNTWLLSWLASTHILPATMSILPFLILIVVNGVVLYLARNRLKLLIGW